MLARRIDVSMMVAEKIQVDLDDFIATQYPKVVAAVGLITGNRQDAADAVQDALLGYISTPPKVAVKNVAAWITVVASNRIRDSYRSKAAEERAHAKLGMVEELSANSSELLDIDLKAAIKNLPMQQRQVVTLHYLMDQSVDTIAEGLGVTSGTIKTQLHRARTALAARLRKEDHRG